MHTFFLGVEQVRAYMRDLSKRLLESEKFPPPSVWVTIGPSGLELANCLGEDTRWTDTVKIVSCTYDRTSKVLGFDDEAEASSIIHGADVLILDSAVHSGNTMRKAIEKTQALKPNNISSYSLILKQTSSLVPNLFALLIGRHDRAYFLLDRIPNMRIMRHGTLRPMEEKDVNAPKIDCENESLNKFGWPELWYDVSADQHRKTFVYERAGNPVAYVSYRLLDDEQMLIDVLAVDKNAKGGGVAANLVRWAETCARANNCKRVVLWAREQLLDFYKKFGYEAAKGKVLKFPDETDFLMRKEIVYDGELDDLLRAE